MFYTGLQNIYRRRKSRISLIIKVALYTVWNNLNKPQQAGLKKNEINERENDNARKSKIASF